MHRSISVPRLVGWSSLLLGLLLWSGLSTASAQQLPPPTPEGTIQVIVKNMTNGSAEKYSMTTRLKLKEVLNPNPKVVNVVKTDDPTAVLLDAVGLGRTRIRFTDEKGTIEYLEVIVVSDLVEELRNMFKRAVPTGVITVTASDGGRTIVLTGNVKSVEDGKAVQQIAGQMFGVTVINQVVISGVQQVQLEVLVASVNRSMIRQMSFTFNQNGNAYFINSIFGGPYSLANSVASGAAAVTSNISQSGSANIPFGFLGSNTSFYAFLQALRTENLTKIMAEPRVLTMSGKKATIVSGGQTPVLTASGVGAPSVSYKDFGTVVSFVPIVLGNGKIHLEVHAEVSNIDPAFGINITGVTPTAVPGFATQVAEVAVQMEDGQTFAIGGLVENDVTASISRVPILGDLPFLGIFFTQKSYQETEKELVILVTPRLVDPLDCTKIPKHLPSRESRTPDDFEFFLEGILEAPRGQRNINAHPGGYKSAFQISPSIGQIPCDDKTGCAFGNGNCAGGNCATGGCASGNCGATTTSYGTPVTTTPVNTQRPAVVQTPPPPTSILSAPVSAPLPTVAPPTNNMPAFPTPTAAPPTLPSPAMPAVPMVPSAPPARELETRPVLPPVSFGPAN